MTCMFFCVFNDMNFPAFEEQNLQLFFLFSLSVISNSKFHLVPKARVNVICNNFCMFWGSFFAHHSCRCVSN